MVTDKAKTECLRNVCIFLFSGTGMTEYVIEKIKSELEQKQVIVDIYPIETVKIRKIDLETYDAIRIAYRVHAYNAPRIVIDFARQKQFAMPIDFVVKYDELKVKS